MRVRALLPATSTSGSADSLFAGHGDEMSVEAAGDRDRARLAPAPWDAAAGGSSRRGTGMREAASKGESNAPYGAKARLEVRDRRPEHRQDEGQVRHEEEGPGVRADQGSTRERLIRSALLRPQPNL